MGWAVIERSLPHLQTAIKADPLGAYETVGYAYVLQLCIFIDWHDGLRLLLATLKETPAGLEHILNHGLWFALFRTWKTHLSSDTVCRDCDMALSARLILETGCRVPYLAVTFIGFPCVRTMIIKHLRNRRERLKDLALKHMNFAQAKHFQLHKPSPCVDTQVMELIQQLEEADIQVPQTLYPNDCLPARIETGRSVWQTIAENHRYAVIFSKQTSLVEWQCLYDAGFTDIDGSCSELLFRTPMMAMDATLHSARFRLWLLDRGSDLSKPFSIQLSDRLSQSSYINVGTAAHKIARDYSLEFTSVAGQHDEWDISLIQRVLLADTPPDCCSCACSLDGCTPLSCLLMGEYKLPMIDQAPVLKSLKRILKWLGPHVQEQGKAATAALIRAFCFNTLALRHTCCKNIFSYGRDWGTAEEFREEMDMIRDEDEELLQEFEDLVQDLVQSFNQSGQSIYQYVSGPLLERVRQVKREWESPDPEFYDRQLTGARMENWDRTVYPEPRASGPQLDAKGPQYDLDRPEDRSLWLEKRLEDIFDDTKPLERLSAAMRTDCTWGDSDDSDDSEETDADETARCESD